MKHIFYALSFLVFFFIMLFFPAETLYGASNGLLLWFQIVIPSLLPFFIITNLLIQTNSVSLIVKVLGPFLTRIFSVTPDGSFAILSGLLCGYPIGAKVTADFASTVNAIIIAPNTTKGDLRRSLRVRFIPFCT